MVLFLGIAIAGCDGSKVTEHHFETVRLVNGLHSYDSAEHVQDSLRKRKVEWRVEVDRRSQGRGAYHVYILHISRFRDLDHEGELRLRFLNNRLFAAMFAPVDFNNYVKQLEVTEGLRFDRPSKAVGVIEARNDGARSVWVNRTPPIGSPFVGWADTRLQREWNSTVD